MVAHLMAAQVCLTCILQGLVIYFDQSIIGVQPACPVQSSTSTSIEAYPTQQDIDLMSLASQKHMLMSG